MEEEYVSDFKSMDNDKYVNLNDINKCLDDVREARLKIAIFI